MSRASKTMGGSKGGGAVGAIFQDPKYKSTNTV